MLDIFVRANEGGTKLSKSDLLLSMVTSKWAGVNAREEIYGFVDRLNNHLARKNDFDKDFVLKTCLVLTDLPVQYKVDTFSNQNLALIQDRWDAIKAAIEAAVNLVNWFGIDRDTLTSANALIPVAYYLYQHPAAHLRSATAAEHPWAVVATTPGGTYGLLKGKWPKEIFGHELCDLLVLDEASQMNLPEAVMAALPLAADAPVVVVGDHRQMPPIVKHDWEAEARRTFRQYAAYESLFDSLRAQGPPIIRFAESFRLHAAMAEFLRQGVYRHDGIRFHSNRADTLPACPVGDDLAAAVLHPDYPLVVVVHDEAESQVRNPFEQALLGPVLKALADPAGYGLDAVDGLGVVVPHRAQRAALQQAFPELCVLDAATGLPGRSAVDTVERFQGGERAVVLVSATESDRAYLLASSGFLLDPRRLTVAVSRAKRKMVLVASRSIFSLFSPDEETFANALLWKNLLLRTCTTLLWEGERDGKRVAVWGGRR